MVARRTAATTDSPQNYGDGREPRRLNVTPSGIVAAVAVLGILWGAASISGKVSENTRRVEQLEAADRQRGDALGRIDARTARIEATLEIFMRGGVQRPLSAPLPPSADQQGVAP